MNTNLRSAFAVILLLATAFTTMAGEPDSDLRKPPLGIDDALTIARDYVQQHKVDVSRCYIDSVRLDLNTHENRGKFWLVTWERNDYAKGGNYYLRIYMDKSVEILYGQ